MAGHKSIACLYTYNKHTEKETAGTLLFTSSSKKIKQRGINLTKEVEGDYHSTSFFLLRFIDLSYVYEYSI